MKTSPYVRTILVVFAVFGVWQVYWLHRAQAAVDAVLPSLLNVSGWKVIWAGVAVLTAWGATSGSDRLARLGFGAVCVASVMGAVTVAIDARPLSTQFWSFGQATVLALSCLVLLLSPLRNPPPHIGDGFPPS